MIIYGVQHRIRILSSQGCERHAQGWSNHVHLMWDIIYTKWGERDGGARSNLQGREGGSMHAMQKVGRGVPWQCIHTCGTKGRNDSTAEGEIMHAREGKGRKKKKRMIRRGRAVGRGLEEMGWGPSSRPVVIWRFVVHLYSSTHIPVCHLARGLHTRT